VPAPRRPAEVGDEHPPSWGQPLANADPGDKAGAAAAPAADRGHAGQPPPVLPLAMRGGEIDEFLRTLAGAAGVSEQIFTNKDPQELARQLGDALRVVVDNLSQLLQARLQAKRLVRSAQHTVIQATENNPLKFSPSAEDALRIMFGPPTRSYLDAHHALVRGFEDIKTHQVKTYSAMQRALTKVLAELDPQVIDRDTGADRGIAAVITSRKASLWDAYVARWQAKQHSEKGGLIDAFMLIFARYYDDDTA